MANYISLLNLPDAILAIGPMVNWWDGGGKGERFIQLVKPLLKRGIRDKETFMVRVVERFYKLNVLKLFDNMYNLFDVKKISEPKEDNAPEEYYLANDGSLRPISERYVVSDDEGDDSEEGDDDDDDDDDDILQTAVK